MPFQQAFDCLWCGTRYEARSPADVEGWAQLCPACVGRAGDNGFLRYRLRAALAERNLGPAGRRKEPAETAAAAGRADAGMIAYYEARAPEYDDWYLRRGRYDRGPIENAVWNADLDAATLWLDGLALGPSVVELAAGTGWWSPLLAQKGELWAYDAAEGPLDRARSRLLAHRLRAHLHVRDAWAPPERAADGLFTGFWLSHVRREDLAAFLRLALGWLRPGGTYAFIDSLLDPASSAVDHPQPHDDRSIRRLADGRKFEIPKVFYRPNELEAALLEAGFATAEATTTGRFFLLGRAVAPSTAAE
ncbi:MAG TPA: class I SAM-dependent methyltransferase [Candidatus Limnocylindrales bacterium]|nr:class I SAM-dependent methyltransferase [Candidatus Limnocylindrales bacterium]